MINSLRGLMFTLDATEKFKYEICQDSGFMRVVGICARSGIQEYLGYELGLSGSQANEIFNVFRPVDEVVASLSSYNGAVVTDNHPDEGIVSADSNHLSKGNTSEAYGYTKDGEYYVIAKITVTDSDLITKIQDGKRELSAGYTRDLVEESGEHNGTPYQFVQKNIKVNHVAIVEEGRCGTTCKLNLDTKGKTTMGIKIQIDGKSVTMDEAEVASYVNELKKEADEANEEVEELKKEVDEAGASVEELTKAIEAKTAELVALQEQLTGMVTVEEAEIMADESVEISEDAEELGVELKEKSNDAKRKEILGAISSSKLSFDGMDKNSLKMVYKISVDQAKEARRLQKDGYKGTTAKGANVPRTGNLSNDLNSIAAAARAERRGAK